jgi:putative heme-binding domain-containing protein
MNLNTRFRRSALLISILCALCVFVVNLSAAETTDDSPAAELASFQIADGFEANLFASEADGVIKPIQIRFDTRGRIWVIGSSVYPQIEPGQVPNDKVLILEDTDHDGRCDKVTVFADGLMIPTGIELANGGAYIGHGTELLFLKDNDGDGKADERRVVLRGFGTGDNHQNINSFLFGPGGEMWMCQGLHIYSNVETPWGIVRLHKAGLWRFRPRIKKLEGFYGSEHEPQNPWGYVFTDWGEPIVIAGNNSSPIYPVPGLVVDHLDLPPALIWKNGQGRKSSGADIVGTTHFPESWQGLVITGGYINNAVWALKILDDGAGFALEDRPPLIRSTSRNFRPVDVKFGPDGALYIADWYNPIIGHYQASFRDPNRDKTHGRIWRITAKGRPLTKPPQLADATIPQLLNDLESPDPWTRHFAKRVLADRPKVEVIAAADKFLAGRSGREAAHALLPEELVLKELLGVYQSHEAPNPDLLARLSHAEDAGARAYAASVIGEWADHLDDPLALLRPLARDKKARVRLQAIVASTYIHSPAAINVALDASSLPLDKFIDYALKQAVHALKPYWLDAFRTGSLKFTPPRILFLVRTDGTPDTLDALRDLSIKPGLNPTSAESIRLALIQNGTAQDITKITLKLATENPPSLTALKALVETSLARKIIPDAEVEPVVTAFVTGKSPAIPQNEKLIRKIRMEGVKLAALWKIASLRDRVAAAALDPNEAIDVRTAAAEALTYYETPENKAALFKLVSGDNPALRRKAFPGLLSLDASTAIDLAANAATSTNAGWNWDSTFTALLQRKGAPPAFARALESKAPCKQVAQAGIRVMNSTGRRDETLAGVLTKALGSEPQHRTIADVAEIARGVREQGDPLRGEAIFRRPELGCVNCHAVKGKGGKIGPELSALGTAQPLDFIIGAILDPQKEIKEGYISTLVITKDDDEFQGYIVREDNREVVLRDTLQNKEIRIPRNSIKLRKQSGSLMPSGLTDSLSKSEFRDLIRYLSELGSAIR